MLSEKPEGNTIRWVTQKEKKEKRSNVALFSSVVYPLNSFCVQQNGILMNIGAQELARSDPRSLL